MKLESKWQLTPFTAGVYFRLKFLPPIAYSKILVAQVAVAAGKYSVFDSRLVYPSDDLQILEILPAPILATRQLAFRLQSGERSFLQLEVNNYLPTETTTGGGSMTSDTSIIKNVAVSIASVPLLEANLDRKGASFVNTAVQSLFLKMGEAATLASYTIELLEGDYFELPYGYRGEVAGIWGQAGAGGVLITEFE